MSNQFAAIRTPQSRASRAVSEDQDLRETGLTLFTICSMGIACETIEQVIATTLANHEPLRGETVKLAGMPQPAALTGYEQNPATAIDSIELLYYPRPVHPPPA